MKYRNILLIQPELDPSLERMSRENIYPPLGLLSIGTYLKRKYSEDLNIKIFDLGIDTYDNCLRAINDSDIIGISINSFNYRNALRIAQLAKENGVVIVLGGIHAKALKREIITKRTFIDYIVDGEGEIPFQMLVEGENPYNIPNLVFRDSASVVETEKIDQDLCNLPIIDRSFLDMEKYIRNFQNSNIYHFDYSRPVSVYSHKGCRWRDISKGCIFCARKDTKCKARPIQQFWCEIEELKNKYDADYVWDIADDFFCELKWAEECIYAKPKDLDIKFLIYARADSISENTVSLLSGINVHEIVIGFESGDPQMLKKARKGCDIECNYNAVKLLSEISVKLYPMFVIGMPNENMESINKTLDFIKYITGVCDVTRFVVSMLIPFPGSIAYQMLRERLNRKYNDRDEFEIDEAVKDWFQYFTQIEDLDSVHLCIKELSNLGYKENIMCNSRYSYEFIKF